jgi:hypothetical protein
MLAVAVTTLCLTSLGLRAATVADWKFDAANPTADSSGNGNTLTLNGNITFTSDVATNAPGSTNSAVFDGASYAQTIGTLNLSPYNAITIEFFAKFSPGTPWAPFCDMNDPNRVMGAFYLDVNEGGQLKVSQGTTGGSGYQTDLAPEPSDGAWHHYALTMDETGASPVFKIYVDGYEVDTGGQAGGIQTFNNDFFTIGAWINGSTPYGLVPYDGLMGEMRVTFGILNPEQFLIGAQAPVIFMSRQPQNTAVVTNSPATFKVVATVQGGNPPPPLQYQWQRNGANISGATNSSYTLPTTTLSDNSAQFDVVLSAPPALPVTSSNATLTVVRSVTVAYWKFDAANPTADSSGNGNTLTLNGNITFTSDVPTNAPGSTNSAVFDGASYAQTIGTLDLSPYNAITIEFFAKFSPGAPWAPFCDMNDPNLVKGAFYLDLSEGGPQLKVSQGTTGGSGYQTDLAPEPSDGAWHHYALTMDESGANPIFKIYVDGYKVDTGGQAGGIQTFNNDFFTIGAWINGSTPYGLVPYDGLMGEMRVTFGILNPGQFLIGAGLPKIFISQQPQNTAVVTNSPATFKVVATVQNGNPPPPLQYQWQRNGVNISGATNSSYTLPTTTLSDNSAQFDVVLSAPPGTPVTSSNATLTVVRSATVADWKFDAANPTADSSGNGNTLTLNGNITFTSDVPTNAPGSTNSAVFDGASYAQTIGTLDLSPYNAITIEFFAKFSPGAPWAPFCDMNDPNLVKGAFYLDLSEGGPQLKVSQGTTGGSGYQTDLAPEPSDGAWHHYALTMDESGANPIFKIYVDGYKVDTGGQAGGIQTFNNDFFTIGAWINGSTPYGLVPYDGLMGEMRVSSGILTPEQFLSGPATLQINVASGYAVISWPGNAENFTLQQAGNLRGAWTTVTNSPVLSGLNWQVRVPTAPTGMFYRLIR